MRSSQDDEGRGAAVFFHSAAHVLGQALERTLGGQLTVGPALKEGFYYDCYMGSETVTEEKTYGPLEKCISAVVKVCAACLPLTDIARPHCLPTSPASVAISARAIRFFHVSHRFILGTYHLGHTFPCLARASSVTLVAVGATEA